MEAEVNKKVEEEVKKSAERYADMLIDISSYIEKHDLYNCVEYSEEQKEEQRKEKIAVCKYKYEMDIDYVDYIVNKIEPVNKKLGNRVRELIPELIVIKREILEKMELRNKKIINKYKREYKNDLIINDYRIPMHLKK